MQNMVKYSPMKSVVAMAVVVAAAVVRAGVHFAAPQLPESPYDDGEISTNIQFCAGDERSRTFSLSFDIDATATNTVQLAFGKDADANGELDWQEIDFLVGWRCGGWFFRDKRAGRESFAPEPDGHRHMDWRLALDKSRRPSSLSATDADQSLGFAHSQGMFRQEWDMARLFARGFAQSASPALGGVLEPGFSLIMR